MQLYSSHIPSFPVRLPLGKSVCLLLPHLVVNLFLHGGRFPACCAEQACLLPTADAALRNSSGGWQHIWTCPVHGAAWLRPGQVCSEGGSPHSGTYLHCAGEWLAALPSPGSVPAPLSTVVGWGWGSWQPQRELVHHRGCLAVGQESCSHSLPKGGIGNHPVDIPAHAQRPGSSTGRGPAGPPGTRGPPPVFGDRDQPVVPCGALVTQMVTPWLPAFGTT